jgi:hypothetical protein
MAEKGILRSFGGYSTQVTVSEQHTDEMTITSNPVERKAMISDHAFKMPAQLTVEMGWSAYQAGVDNGTVTIDVAAQTNANPNLATAKAYTQFRTVVSAIGGSNAVGVLSSAYRGASLSGASASQQIQSMYDTVRPTVAAYGGSAAIAVLDNTFTNIKKSDSNARATDQSFVGQQALIDLYQKLLVMQSNATIIEVQTGKRLYQNMLIKSLRTTTDQRTENVLLISATLQEIILVDTLVTTLPKNNVMAAPSATGAIMSTGTKSLVQ